MTLMRIFLPCVDRKAALLAGIELGPTPTLDASPSDFGDDWRLVAEALEPKSDGSAVFPLTVAAPTVEALIAATKTHRDNAAAKAAAEEEKWQSKLAATEAQAAEWERAMDEPLPIDALEVYDADYGYLGKIDGVCAPDRNRKLGDTLHPWMGVPEQYRPAMLRMDAAHKALEARAKTENAALREAALPRLRVERAAVLAQHAQEKEAKEAADAAARIERGQKRLADGAWERETSSYNPRRDSKPWCARVTGVDARGKLVYEWGEWTGREGEAGLLRIAPCAPGDIIAWGQKDFKRPKYSVHEILRMGEDGLMSELTAVEAARALRGEK